MRPFKNSVATRMPELRVTRVLPTLRTCMQTSYPSYNPASPCVAVHAQLRVRRSKLESINTNLERRRSLDVIPVFLGESVHLLLALALLTLRKALVLPLYPNQPSSQPLLHVPFVRIQLPQNKSLKSTFVILNTPCRTGYTTALARLQAVLYPSSTCRHAPSCCPPHEHHIIWSQPMSPRRCEQYAP